MISSISTRLSNYVFEQAIRRSGHLNIGNGQIPITSYLWKKIFLRQYGDNSSAAFFCDKNALVTGGASGIGLEICKEILKQGANGITIADIDRKAGEKALKEICKIYGNDRAIFVECDVSRSELLDWAFKNAIKAFDRLDIVVNNAAILNDKKWETELATNINGYLVGNLLGLQYMSKVYQGEGGVILNVCSVFGLKPTGGAPVYSMTQAAVVGLTRSLGEGKQIHRTNVKVVGLALGPTRTKLLEGAVENALNDKFGAELHGAIGCEYPQEPSVAAQSAIEVIQNGESGSIWIAEKGQPPCLYEFECDEKEEEKVENYLGITPPECIEKKPDCETPPPPPPPPPPAQASSKDECDEIKEKEKPKEEEKPTDCKLEEKKEGEAKEGEAECKN